jgi:hypothetical protein
MHNYGNPPPDDIPYGLLLMLDEDHCDLIWQEDKFRNRIAKAMSEGNLYCPQTLSIQ